MLKRALFYSYTTAPDIAFYEENTSTAIHESTSLSGESHPETMHLSPSDSNVCFRLMTHISESFSPTLFQPPPALHMECTDVYADLWMENAVQPAFSDAGISKPFETLARLRKLNWKRDASDHSNGRSEPCDECLDHRRKDWLEEAIAIWNRMDEWIDQGNS